MLNPNFVILGLVIHFLGSFSYLVSTVKGETKPNKVTWFLWALVPMIAFAAEIKEGVGIRSLTTFGLGFSPLVIFFASFVNKKSFWKLSRFDIVCGGLALAGIFLWYVTRNSNFAILFSILADGLAAAPTVVKAYYFPETENYHVYLGSVASSTVRLLTIDNWNFVNLGFPAYILILCAGLVFLVKRKRNTTRAATV